MNKIVLTISLLFLCLFSQSAASQTSPDLEQGLKPYGSYHGGDIDSVNLATGNLTVHIPFLSYPQLGRLQLGFSLVYNAETWHAQALQGGMRPVYAFVFGGIQCFRGGMSVIDSITWCPGQPIQEEYGGPDPGTDCSQVICSPPTMVWSVASIVDPQGGTHQLAPSVQSPGTSVSMDATGIQINGSGIVTSDGTRYDPGTAINPSSTGYVLVQDVYGNQITGGGGQITDSVGRTLPAWVGTDTSQCPAGTTSAQSWTVPAYNANGNGSATYIQCFTVTAITTNYDFGYQPSDQYPRYVNGSATPSLLTAFILPATASGSQKWLFAYDGQGNLVKLTLPTGGYIEYEWTTMSVPTSSSILAFNSVITKRSVYAGDGSQPSVWQYSINPSGASTSTVTDPLLNVTTHAYGLPCSGYETSVANYQGSVDPSHLLKRVDTSYTYLVNPADQGNTCVNVVPVAVKTTLHGGQQSLEIKTYDSGQTVQDVSVPTGNPPQTYPVILGSINSSTEYGFGTYSNFTPTGPPLKVATTQWLWQQDANYRQAGLLKLPSSVQIADGSGVQQSLTTYIYDETAFSAGGVLGSPTTTTHWNNLDPTYSPTSHVGWNSVGMKSFVIDALNNVRAATGHTADYEYGQCGASLMTRTTNVLGQAISGTYDCNSGLLTSFTDANSQTTQYAFDVFNRINMAIGPQMSLPGGGTGQSTATFTYDDANRTVTKTVAATPNPTQTIEATFDGLGRESHRYLTAGSTQYTTDTAYGIDGRTLSVSNPYITQQDSTYGLTLKAYDALGRAVIQQHPDGSVLLSCYDNVPASTNQSGFSVSTNQSICTSLAPQHLQNPLATWVDSADEIGTHMQHSSDAFGRLVGVMELGTSAKPTALETDYTYNALNSLTGIIQYGNGNETLRTRSFGYDSLSRLQSSTNPEAGTISYTYDADGNVTTKTSPAQNGAAGAVTVGYCYDALNRLSLKFYLTSPSGLNCPAGGTSGSAYPNNAVAAYTYDGSALSGAANTVGRLTSEVTLSGGVVQSQVSPFAYDAMGRVTAEQQCPIASCSTQYDFQYSYDLAGALVNANNGLPAGSPQAITLGYANDNAGRLDIVTSSLTGAASPTTLFQATATNAYGPAGLLNAQLGVTQGAQALSMSRAYDNRMRLLSENDYGEVITTPATQSSGTMTVTGMERQALAATPGTAHIVTSSAGAYMSACVSGYSSCVRFPPYNNPVSLNVSGFVVSATPTGSLPTFVQSLANQINSSSSSSVTAALSDSGYGLILTSKTGGSGTNYPLSFDLDGNDLSCSVSTNYALSGGADGVPADTGSIVLSMGGANAAAVNWGASDNAASVAQHLEAAIATAFGSSVTPTVTGSSNSISIQLHSTQTGGATNYAINVNASGGSSFSVTPATMSGGANAATAPGTVYGFSLAGTLAANGNVMGYTDTVMGTWSFSYDGLNRLTNAAASSPGTNVSITAQNYCYDSFGNRWPGTGAISSSACSPTGANNFAPNNQLQALGYDLAGNVNTDLNFGSGGNFYNYDQENRVQLVNGTTAYRYDAEGRRVAKGIVQNGSFAPSALYLYGPSGEQVTELDGAGNWNHSNVYAGGKLLASYDAAGVHYQLTDWLGTRRVQASASGVQEEKCISYPFGDGLACAGSEATNLHFTGKERDAESGLDFFGARYYASSMGRWMSPDWSPVPVPVPYANLADPQTLNLYSYTWNNPLSRVDTGGHDPGDSNSMLDMFNNYHGHGIIAPQSGGQAPECGASNCRITMTILSSRVHQSFLSKVGSFFSGLFSPGTVHAQEEGAEGDFLEAARPPEIEPIEPGEMMPGLPSRTWNYLTEEGPLTKLGLDSVVSSFSGGQYSEFIVPEGGFGFNAYRVWGGPATLEGGANGTYYSPFPQVGGIQSLIDNAIMPQWNNGGVVSCVNLSPGTVTYVGISAAQGGAYLGGNVQIYVPK